MGERTPHLDPHARAALVGLAGIAHARPRRPRDPRRRRVQPEGHASRSSSEMQVPVDDGPPRRRRRALAALAPDPGRRLRLPGRDRRSRRRRGVRRGAARRRRRRRVEDGRRRLRRRRPRRQRASRPNPADRATLARQLRAIPRVVSGAASDRRIGCAGRDAWRTCKCTDVRHVRTWPDFSPTSSLSMAIRIEP